MNAIKRRRPSQAGFTLIELLVASVAGLFVVLAAFMLSRGATRLFAAEGRVANSQLNLRLGIDRLRQDLERAGYMTTANVSTDPDVCPRPASAGGAVLPLQSVLLKLGDPSSALTPASAKNGLYPDQITLTGNFASTDIYLAASILPSSSGGGYDIALQKNWGSTARLLNTGETGSATSALQSVFAVDRMIRVRNSVGVSQFLLVESAAIAGDGRPVITTKATPAYAMASSGGAVDKRCGGTGFCLGCEVNPVQIINYQVGTLASDSRFAWAYPTGGVGDANKYDLIRTELKPDGTVVKDSEEIVAEYAVDLAFAFGVDSSVSITPGGAFIEPAVAQLPFGNKDNLLYGDPVASSTARPQRIRSVRYRLSTRTRFPDNSTAVDDGGAGLLRYKLGEEQYSRVRTIIGDIALINQQGLRW
jgi:prepilin-type N-terminal cleavage/methylation domain-containing protein